MMITHSWRRMALVLIAVGTVLLGGAPAAIPTGAAAPPTLTMQVNGGKLSVTVVDRQPFLINALGFRPGESVKITATFPAYSGVTIVVSRTIQANSAGAVLNVSMVVPADARAMTAGVTAMGLSSGRYAYGNVPVVYQPYITLSPKSIDPGSAFVVSGYGFVANSAIQVQVSFHGTLGAAHTVSVSANADVNGNFTRRITLPNYTASGAYTVSATDTVGGFKRYATITVNQRPGPRPTSTRTPLPTPTPVPTLTPVPRPVYHAVGVVAPSVTLPNQNITFTGSGFPSNTIVAVSLTLTLRIGGIRILSRNVVTDSRGSLVTAFRVPYKTAPGLYAVNAVTSVAQASGQFQVLPLSAHPKDLTFDWISLWYHTVRHGTWDRVVVQGSPHTQLGIWVHVVFPSGKHRDYYKVTNRHGRWTTRFTIPQHAGSSRSHIAYITFQLWHGQQTSQTFMTFLVV